ncbi:MAG: MFS transporter [bacterium]|nr:MFS transporter [bacterium]
MIRRLREFGGEAWAWMSYDFANSAFATSIMAVIFNKYYAGVIAGGEAGTDFHFFGRLINVPGASLFQFSVLAGTILTVIFSPFIGIYADLTGTKKRLLIILTVIGGVATLLLAPMGAGDVIPAGLLYALALAAFFLATNLYNAFLPQISKPQNIGLISGISWAIGYIGGGLCLLLNLLMLQNPRVLGFAPGTFGVPHVIISVAFWWWIFSLPTFIGVRERPARTDSIQKSNPRHVLRNFLVTFKQMRRFKQLWIFLLAYLFFTNGIETTISSASIFGDQELHMDTAQLIVLFLIVQFTAFPGAVLFGVLVDRLGNKRALSISLFVWIIALLWVYRLGLFFDPITEFRLVAILVGLVLGGSQAAARSLFASFTPPERSGEFFGFFGIAGRLASTLGPLSFAVVNIATRSIRLAVIAMVVFFIIGILILFKVNEAEGIKAASSQG